MAANERTTQQKSRTLNHCPQCGDALLAPVWSEHVKERCVRHLWNCDACGYTYESMVYLAPQAMDDAA